MSLPNNTFCVLPWISLEASPIGTVRPCCMADNEVTDNDGNKYDLTTASLTDVRESMFMETLRSQFISGERPSMCRRCWAEEDAGRVSKRMNTIRRLEHVLPKDITWTLDPEEMYFLDLKLGNICNLKCRICGSWSSSTFAGEEIKFAQDPSYHKEMNRKGAWPRKTEHFWDELALASPNLRYLEFTGGEPFMIKEHFEYLERLIRQGLAANIEIHYNTNGTIPVDRSWEHIWKHFKHVEIAVSIDNVGDRFNYERTNASFWEVDNNVEDLINLRNNLSNISLQLCCTVNVYNVLYLEDVVEWEHFNDFDFVFWNMLHDSPENCIKSLPQDTKELASDILLTADVDDATAREFRGIVDFMMSGEGVSYETLMSRISTLDARRNVHLGETHPELAMSLSGLSKLDLLDK